MFTMNTASIAANKISVNHTVCDNREFLTFNVPNGWDDVKPLTNKVLSHCGNDYTFSGWCSDRNQCWFVRILNGPSFVAVIK